MNRTKVKCTYVTESDAGDFYSNAFVNLETGQVFDIESCNDPAQEDINTVHKEYICFDFEGHKFDCDVYDIDNFLIKIPEDVKKIIFMDDLDSSMSSNSNIKVKPKV